MWLGLMALSVTLWCYGLPPWAAGLFGPLLTLLPPIVFSLLQLTMVWLVCLALAWRFRQHAFLAGVLIGLAALTKYFPAILLVPFVRERRWSALLGFASVWAAALGFVIALNPSALSGYVRASAIEALAQAMRSDNSSLFFYAFVHGKAAGLLAAIALFLAVCLASLRRFTTTPSMDRLSWAQWNWVASAALPISWWFSIIPLLPVHWTLLTRERLPVRSLVLIGLIPTLLPGAMGQWPMPVPLAFACLVLVGLALGLDAMLGSRVRRTHSPT